MEHLTKILKFYRLFGSSAVFGMNLEKFVKRVM